MRIAGSGAAKGLEAPSRGPDAAFGSPRDPLTGLEPVAACLDQFRLVAMVTSAPYALAQPEPHCHGSARCGVEIPTTGRARSTWFGVDLYCG